MGRFQETYNDPLLWACRPSHCCDLTLFSRGGFFHSNYHGPKLLLPFNFNTVFFHVRSRVENNGRSTDNVLPDREFRHPRMMILKVERTLNTQKL